MNYQLSLLLLISMWLFKKKGKVERKERGFKCKVLKYTIYKEGGVDGEGERYASIHRAEPN